MRRSLLGLIAPALLLIGQSPKTYLVKLSTPVRAEKSRPGDLIRAAIISPESYLNGYLEGTVERASAKPRATMLLRFDKLVFKGTSTPVKTEVVEWVNSKGHKSVDDAERATTIEKGELRTAGRQLWLDEGAEIRLRVDP